VVANTYVETATVQLLLPATVLVRIQERQPVILWQSGGLNYEVTASGEVLGVARNTDPAALVVYDTRNLPLTPGVFVDPDALQLAQILHLRVPAEIGFTPSRYEWDPYYGLSMYRDGRQIALGRLNDPALPLDVKLATLKPLVEDGTDYTLLDLRSLKPYYRAPTPTPTATPTP
jgi:cell division protein FtsQ